MTQELKLFLKRNQVEYPIYIGESLLQSRLLKDYCGSLGHRFAIIADTHTESLFGKKLKQVMEAQGFEAHLFAFPPGEQYKTRETKQSLEDQMLASGLGRDTCLIALGGGIVIDVAGFVASTYCRGIPFVLVPTTLLGMVDASIGGKTGVNVPQGKNLIGTIAQPSAIFMDLTLLKSLPENELKNGLVECLKHGLILDSDYYNFLESHTEAILKGDISLLEKVIADSCRIKKEVVEEDEQERGKRRLLNFGHTIGHAIETLTHHTIPHGLAVAIGIVAESYLSMKLKQLSPQSFERIVKVFKKFGIKTTLDIPLKPEDFFQVLKLDKKSVNNRPRFVMIQEIGNCLECDGEYCQSVDSEILRSTLEWTCHVMHHD